MRPSDIAVPIGFLLFLATFVFLGIRYMGVASYLSMLFWLLVLPGAITAVGLFWYFRNEAKKIDAAKDSADWGIMHARKALQQIDKTKAADLIPKVTGASFHALRATLKKEINELKDLKNSLDGTDDTRAPEKIAAIDRHKDRVFDLIAGWEHWCAEHIDDNTDS